jgi:uncharacterized protein (DUF1330 family)
LIHARLSEVRGVKLGLYNLYRKLLDLPSNIHYDDPNKNPGGSMAKAYWVTFYHSILNPTALAEYAKIAGPAIQAGGGRFLARGLPAKVYDAGKSERVVVIEFDSLEQAIATHDGAAYAPALKVLEGAVVREVRIIEGAA